jgi:hypothetical protein
MQGSPSPKKLTMMTAPISAISFLLAFAFACNAIRLNALLVVDVSSQHVGAPEPKTTSLVSSSLLPPLGAELSHPSTLSSLQDTTDGSFLTGVPSIVHIPKPPETSNVSVVSLPPTTTIAPIIFSSSGVPPNVSTEEPSRFYYHWEWHPPRHERFPSIDERVRIYMSNWYLPPCTNATKFHHHFLVPPNADGNSVLEIRQENSVLPTNVSSYVLSDQPVLLNRDALLECVKFSRPKDWDISVGRRQNLRYYTEDSIPLLDLVGNTTPVLAKFGDSPSKLNFPIFAKWRFLANQEAIKNITTSSSLMSCSGDKRMHLSTFERVPPKFPFAPILWKLNQNRHWLPMQNTRELDVPWKSKIPMAVWRGAFTGKCLKSNGFIMHEMDCLSNSRCRFVYDHIDSSLVDAGLVPSTAVSKNFKLPVRKNVMKMKDLLKYKIIISLEGNDVASGLKWQLLSKSVVMMPAPTRTSWAMEELLEPWVHYIPIHVNGSDAEERVQWVLEHDDEARKIAERGSLFMYDMIFHSSALDEERAVMNEITRRYRELWT